MRSVIYGHAVSLFTSFYQVSHHSTARLIKKLWRKLRLVSSLSQTQSGLLFPIKAKISSPSFSQKTRMLDHLLNKHSNFLGFNKLLKSKRKMFQKMLVCLPSQTLVNSTPLLSSSRPPSLSLLLSFSLNRKERTSIRFSEQWTPMAMESSTRRKFSLDISNSLAKSWAMKKSMICSQRSM